MQTGVKIQKQFVYYTKTQSRGKCVTSSFGSDKWISILNVYPAKNRAWGGLTPFAVTLLCHSHMRQHYSAGIMILTPCSALPAFSLWVIMLELKHTLLRVKFLVFVLNALLMCVNWSGYEASVVRRNPTFTFWSFHTESYRMYELYWQVWERKIICRFVNSPQPDIFFCST